MLFPIDKLNNWFLKNKRSFPWRENPTPYRVWVSEVMLQQTIASVVVPYFERWMEKFPTIDALAKASIDDVIKMWEGLGYYSRARNLHRGAQFVMTHFQGNLPDTSEELFLIPGLGHYTVGAILSFAFHKRFPAIDANVIRFITRYFQIEDEVEKKETQKKIASCVDSILPEKKSHIATEALIELGATVCKKKPLCLSCPLLSSCKSYRNGVQEMLPIKQKKQKCTPLFRLVGIIEHKGEILLRKGERGKVMEDLYEFPYVELDAAPHLPQEALSRLESLINSPLTIIEKLKEEKHSFTRFRAHLFPYHCTLTKKPAGIWVKKEELFSLPFSSGHRRVLATFLEAFL